MTENLNKQVFKRELSNDNNKVSSPRVAGPRYSYKNCTKHNVFFYYIANAKKIGCQQCRAEASKSNQQ